MLNLLFILLSSSAIGEDAWRRFYSFWYWPQCRRTIGEIVEGEFKEGAWVNKAKGKGDVNKAAT